MNITKIVLGVLVCILGIVYVISFATAMECYNSNHQAPIMAIEQPENPCNFFAQFWYITKVFGSLVGMVVIGFGPFFVLAALGATLIDEGVKK